MDQHMKDGCGSSMLEECFFLPILSFLTMPLSRTQNRTTHLYCMVPSKIPTITQLIGGAVVCSYLTGKVNLCLCQFVL